jgi:hypothetical protein
MSTSTAAFPDEVVRLYRPSPPGPRIVDVPEMAFLAIDGAGDPASSPAYTAAVGALYAVSYAVRFDLKRAGLVYSVMPLEGLWSTDAQGDVWASRAVWRWTMQIAQPDAATGDVIERALAKASSKHPAALLDRVRLDRVTEGRSVQLLHLGAYGEAERPSVEALHAFIADEGLAARGRHHEVYLSDPRRTAPERLRTLLRQPVE